MTQQQIADALEVSQKHVSRRLGYAVLPEVVLNSFRHNEILKEGHAHELCNLDKMSKSEWLNRALFLTEIIEGILNRNRKNEISANIFKSEVQKYNQAIEEYKKCRSELAESYHKEFDNLLNQGKTRSSSGIRRVATRILEKISKDRLEAERKRRAEINDLEAKRIEAEKAVERQKNTQSILERLFNEDAVSAIAKMPENIKLVFTDPPYGMGFQSGRREKTAKADKIKNDSSQDQANELLSKYLQAIYPKMEENSHLLVWCKWSSERHFMNIIESMGFELKGSVVWHKHNHGTGDLKGSFAPKHERIIHAVKGKPEFITRLPDVLNGVELLESDHPTPKPLDLIQNIVEALTYEKEIVVDGFMGSGSTGVATVRCGRVFYGSDLDNRWFNEAQENIYKVIK